MYDEKDIQINKKTKEKRKNKKEIKNKKRKINNHKKISIDLSNLKNVDWKNLIIKIIIVFAVMFLIIFTISRINKATKPKANEVINQNDNLTYLTNTLLNYYNTKKLPKNAGDSTSMILKEMLDFNIIKNIQPNEQEIYDSKNSYIIVTKQSDETFKLRINLKWSTNELTLTQLFTCTEKNCTLKK